ncbi:MAG: CvpA family protein [Treponema sp.]|nr:CvpA family protein [Treponema sp.]
MTFTVMDFIFMGLIGLFMIRCYLKGFVSELFSMAGLVFGILAALFFYKNGGEFLRTQFWPDLNNIIPEIIAFIALFIIVLITVKMLAVMLKGIINGIKLGGIDRFLGIIFGMAEGIAVISLVLFIINIQPLFNSSSILTGSFFANLLLPLISGV